MLIFDDLTIIICVVLLLLALLSVLADSFMRRIPATDCNVENGRFRPVSIIIIADNSSQELNKHLPAFLSQDYPAGYEVIVVVGKNEDDTDDVLKTFGGHGNLYTTFVPDSSRYMSRRKLAITLGVKAAKNDLILLTDAECCPDTDKWIQSMAGTCIVNNADMVIGYSNYDAETKHFRIFERLFREYSFMREAAQGHPYAIAGNNLMIKKSMFMEGKGFQGNLKYLRGEYEFIVNKYGELNNVAVSTSPDSYLAEDVPTKRTFINKGVFYAETRRHLGRGFSHRAVFNADMFFLHTGLWLPVLGGIYAGLTGRWIALAVALVALVVPVITRTITARRAVSLFKAPLSASGFFVNELRLVWHNLAVAWRHKKADNTDFISHKS